MRSALAIGLALLVITETVIACVDVLFVLDPSSEYSRSLSKKVANELAKRSGLRNSVAIRRHEGRYIFMMAKTSADLIATLDTVDGDYERYLNMVTSEIMRRRNARALMILLFSEAAVNATLTAKWKELSQDKKIHIFRIGTAKPTTSFRRVTVPGPKIRPVYRRKDENSEIDKVAAYTAISTRRPLIQGSFAESQPLSTTSRVTTPSPRSHPVFHRSDIESTRLITHDIHPGPQHLTRKSSVESEPASPTRASSSHAVVRPIAPLAIATTRAFRTSTHAPTTAVDRTPPGCVADIVFLMDFSDGTGDKSKALKRTDPVLFLDDACFGTHKVSLVRFSGPGRTETLFHLDKHSNKDDLIEELFRMQPTGGTTRTGEAIHYAIKEFENEKHGARKHARKIIVLFTDGYAQDDPATAADTAREQGITVLAVAVTDRFKPNEQELIDITRNREMILVSPNGQQIREKILGTQCPL
ncbi:von Willebrand factor type A domain protein [Trichostrongylus colubriformis]|uniref:von Willebrand factor type A domain protein n=1 Tax=Trichostrongylus colubriformis TaxID=6319 RepID=A0AAN8FT60_TRICO